MKIVGTTSSNVVTGLAANQIKATKDNISQVENEQVKVSIEDTARENLNTREASETAFVPQTNSIDSLTAYQQSSSDSMTRLTQEVEDVDSEKYISDSNKQKLLGLYQMYSQKLDVNSQENLLTTMFGR